jgi:very-short-patch-repair endonuclease
MACQAVGEREVMVRRAGPGRPSMTSNHRPKPQCTRSPFQGLTLKQRARVMRHSPTESEAALWRLLKGRQLGVSFKRQVPLLGYIVDFYASEVKLVVDVDGGYHAERVALDAKRQRRLERAGYRVVRVESETVLQQPATALASVQEWLAA